MTEPAQPGENSAAGSAQPAAAAVPISDRNNDANYRAPRCDVCCATQPPNWPARPDHPPRAHAATRCPTCAPAAPRRASLQISDFDIVGRLGDGSFSTVILAKLRHGDDEHFAIKVVNKHLVLRNRMADYIRNERNILDQLSYDGIVRLRFTFQDSDSLCACGAGLDRAGRCRVACGWRGGQGRPLGWLSACGAAGGVSCEWGAGASGGRPLPGWLWMAGWRGGADRAAARPQVVQRWAGPAA